MFERGISEKLIEESLQRPTKVLYDKQGRVLIKKLYFKFRKVRLLLIAAEKRINHLRIITVIDTSKIKKYL